MGFDLNRRSLMLSGAALSAMAGTSLLGGCESLLQKILNRPTRRGTQSLSPTDPIWSVYASAVSAMKALPSSDRRNWVKQAEIHLDHCPHGNWYFLPWHRAYLFYFEKICRELSGDDDFALPYWNWNQTRSIPAPFWSGSLNDTTRLVGPGGQADGSFVGDAELNQILALTNFHQFASYPLSTGGGYGSLEATPHNYIHGFVSGNMGSYMSPLDPIFWLHHNMVDCMWWHWNSAGNPNTNDPDWTGHTFSGHFADEHGSPVDIQVAATPIMPLLSYRFEPCQIGVTVEDVDEIDYRRLRRFLEEGARVPSQLDDAAVLVRTAELAADEPGHRPVTLPPDLVRRALEGEAPHVVLELNDVIPPADEAYFVRVYLDLPGATARTGTETPHYAGAFAFFTDPEAHRAHGGQEVNFHVDIAPGLRRLAQAGLIGDSVDIQLVPVPTTPQREVRGRRLQLGTIRAGVLPGVATRFDRMKE